MPFRSIGPMIGPNLTNVDTTQRFPLGTRVRGIDPVYGEGEFIYCRGVASGVLGDAVVFDENFQVTRTVLASRGSFAVALAAVLANQFGWYQVYGQAVVRSATAAADAKPQTTATAGQIDDLAAAGQDIAGARYMTADGTPSAGLAILELSYPSCNGTMI